VEISYIKGDLVALGKEGKYDVIAHGNNCFCEQGRGIAKHFAREFKTDDPSLYRLENERYKGDINKLGQMEYRHHTLESDKSRSVIVVNLYTQYRYGTKQINIDYDALRLCLRKVGFRFKGKSIGLPKIGAGLAGGDWQIILRMIRQELSECTVTIVEYEREGNKA
jgi:O-acetyl-ADP-ribose deacetylase (regulator of RNase III)